MGAELSLPGKQQPHIPFSPLRPNGQATEAIWEDFEMGFWHPFGKHGRETPSDILRRKRGETERNGWTL